MGLTSIYPDLRPCPCYLLTFRRGRDRGRQVIIFAAIGVIVLALGGLGGAQQVIKAGEAGAHVGKHRTVCGQVASATFSVQSRRQPTFLNLDRPYPNQIFTVVIWGQDRPKFRTAPEKLYSGKQICVSGLISTYKGVPQIVVDDPSQISLH